MLHYEEEFNKLIIVERHLVNAYSELSTAEQRLGGAGLLRDNIRQTLEALDEALELTRKAKKIMLTEWQQSMVPAPVA